MEIFEEYIYSNYERDCFKDELGGIHDEGLGWNPNGVFCGECSAITCKGCPNSEEKDVLWDLEIPDTAISKIDQMIDLTQCTMKFKDKRVK